MSEQKHCTYCRDGFFNGKDRIFDTDNFGVVACLKPEFPYQGLFIPRNHFRSLGYLPDALVPEFKRLKAAVGNAIKDLLPNHTIFFHEHGDSENEDYDNKSNQPNSDFNYSFYCLSGFRDFVLC